MKRTLLATCILFSTVAFYACDSNQNKQETTTANNGDVTPVAGDTVPLSDKEKNLMPEAAIASMLQVELGKVALEKGKSDNVKQYAQFMVDNYTSKKQELYDYAASEGVSMPQTLDDKQRKRVEKLRDTDPEKFDMEYWDATIKAHKDAIKEFDNVLKLRKERKGKKVEANSFELWAMNTLKEKHAQMANAHRYRLDLKNRQ